MPLAKVGYRSQIHKKCFPAHLLEASDNGFTNLPYFPFIAKELYLGESLTAMKRPYLIFFAFPYLSLISCSSRKRPQTILAIAFETLLISDSADLWFARATSDFNGDGRDEAFISHSERAGYPVAMYSAPESTDGMWVSSASAHTMERNSNSF